MQRQKTLPSISGFSPNFKRKNTRLLQKFQRGQDGAESKKVETEILMGYDIMDVVTPPYNLDYLAKIYEYLHHTLLHVMQRLQILLVLDMSLLKHVRQKKRCLSTGMTRRSLLHLEED